MDIEIEESVEIEGFTIIDFFILLGEYFQDVEERLTKLEKSLGEKKKEKQA